LKAFLILTNKKAIKVNTGKIHIIRTVSLTSSLIDVEYCQDKNRLHRCAIVRFSVNVVDEVISYIFFILSLR